MLITNRTMTLEDIIHNAITTVMDDKDEFSAYDITKEVHNRIRHNHIRTLVHDVLSDYIQTGMLSTTNKSITVNNGGSPQQVSFINYVVRKVKPLQTNNGRLIIDFPFGHDGDKVFLMSGPDELVLTRDYYDYNSQQYHVEASYFITNGQINMNELRISDELGDYDITVRGNDVVFTEK